MKKVLSVFVAVILAVSVCGLAAFAARNGDMDADNRITAADARSILRAAGRQRHRRRRAHRAAPFGGAGPCFG